MASGEFVATNGGTVKWASDGSLQEKTHLGRLSVRYRKRSRDITGDQEVNGERNAGLLMLQILNGTKGNTDRTVPVTKRHSTRTTVPHMHPSYMPEVLWRDRVKKVAKLVFGSLSSQGTEQVTIKRTN